MLNHTRIENRPSLEVLRGGPPERRAGRRTARTRRRPSVEGLEARALLSTMFVDDDWTGLSNGTDVGGGRVVGTNAFATIPAAITRAANGDAVQIAEGSYTGAVSISKSLSLVGAGPGLVTLDVSGVATNYGVSIGASDVGLSGVTIVGSTTNVKLRYGIYASGRSNLTLENLVVHGMPSSGVNLNGTTDVTIAGVTSRDNNGAGLFLTDVKRATLTDVATSGNVWTGLAFSTAGRYHPIGVEGVVIAGASTFGEVAAANGGVMFEESSWDGTAYDPTNPHPITFSTDPADEADVTFTLDTPLGYVLSGPQNDEWSVRRRFYQTLAQGLDAAAGSPDHYLAHDRTLATVGGFDSARTFTVGSFATMSIQAAIDAASAGDVVQVRAGTYVENLAIDGSIALEAVGEGDAVLLPASGAAVSITGLGAAVRGFHIAAGDRGVQLHGVVGGVVLEDLVITGTTVGIESVAGATLSGLSVRSGVIASNGTGLLIGEGAEGVSIRWSRIVGNTTSALTNLSASPVDAASNWWGSNTGPGAAASGLVTSAPYMVLRIANPGPLLVGGSASVAVDLTHDSAGQDVSGLGRIPGLPPVQLGASLGSFAPGSFALVDGVGSALFSAGLTPGLANLTASVDGATATAAVGVLSPPLFLGGPAFADRGSAYTLVLSGAASQWWIDWGDGDVEAIAGPAISASHVYLGAPGSYAISATAQTPQGIYEARNAVPVTLRNVAPTVAIADAPGSLNQGGSAVVRAVASGPGGEPLTYAWTATRDGVVVFTGDRETFAFAPILPGAYVLQATVTDPYGATARASQLVAVRNLGPTVAIADAPGSLDQGEVVVVRAVASDLGGDSLNYAWVATRDGEIVATGDRETFTFAPVVPGSYVLRVVASDPYGATAEASQGVAVRNVGPTVVIPPVPAQVDPASALTLAVQATDPNPGAVLSYAWTVRRNGMVVAIGDRAVLEFTPGFPGAYEAVVEVSDGEGGVASRSVAFAAVSATVPAAVESSVEALVTRTDAVVQEQQARLAAMSDQYGPNPPPTIQRAMQQIIRSTARLQVLTVRRVSAIQRAFSRMSRR